MGARVVGVSRGNPAYCRSNSLTLLPYDDIGRNYACTTPVLASSLLLLSHSVGLISGCARVVPAAAVSLVAAPEGPPRPRQPAKLAFSARAVASRRRIIDVELCRAVCTAIGHLGTNPSLLSAPLPPTSPWWPHSVRPSPPSTEWRRRRMARSGQLWRPDPRSCDGRASRTPIRPRRRSARRPEVARTPWSGFTLDGAATVTAAAVAACSWPCCSEGHGSGSFSAGRRAVALIPSTSATVRLSRRRFAATRRCTRQGGGHE